MPRGLLVGTALALALAWGLYMVLGGLAFTLVQTALYLGNVLLTCFWRSEKVALVRLGQRYLLNPLFRGLFAIGLNPLGLAVLETRGRTTGQRRRVPVGNGRLGGVFWIIAEHGERAGYVRNIRHDPRVRVRLRIGWRYRWCEGNAEVLPDDDPLARQRRIARWHPLRAVNAMNVRVLGADLLVVRVVLRLPGASTASHAVEGARVVAVPPEPAMAAQ